MANESWQSAWVEVLPDFSEFAKTAKTRMTGILGPAGAAGGIMAGNLAGNLFKGTFLQILGGVLGANIVTGIGYSIGRTIGNAISGGIAYAVSSVSLASDLEQSLGAVEAVFKDQAKFIDDLSLTAAKSLGLSQQSFQSFATLIGAQLKNLGIPFEKVSGQAAELVQLGADLAAQFGGPTADAVSALSAVLRGERDPIERYGVSIKQSDINARLAAAGLKGLTGEAKKQAEIQATLAILYEQTADAQGTFARESDTLAGQQQRLQASLEDTQTRLGTALLPSFTNLATFANDVLVPRLDEVIGRVGPVLGAALERATPKIKDMLDEVTPLVEKFIDWAATDGLPAVIDGMGDLADAAPGWIAAFHAIDDAMSNIFSAIVPTQEAVEARNAALGMPDGLWAKLTGEWDRYFTFLNDAHDRFNKWAQGLVDGWVGMFTDIGYNLANFQITVGQAIDNAVGFIASLPQRAIDGLGNIGATLIGSGRSLIQGFIDGVHQMFKPAGDAIAGIMNYIAGFFPHSPAERGPFSGQGWAKLLASGGSIMDAFESGLRPVAVPLSLSVPDGPRFSVAAGRREELLAGQSDRTVSAMPLDLSEASLQRLAQIIVGLNRVQARSGVAHG